ncbi:NRDE family protein [Marinimicrococcus flavescens]|uniref:NRDE family protein n=1 Tax=Marinimicrococcus flavescens TaxID=3031815 RepID=A0AAP3XQN0_9PROT|nr:NRDE family protein [Marinimicrococcus flavescens]
MCTLVLLKRPGHEWPLLLAANRDELASRASRPPGRHWHDRADVVAGLDLAGGGSWLGLNDHGVTAAVLNRPGSLGPAPGKRSRGELVLEALDHAEAAAAAEALEALDPSAYRPFNLVVCDAEQAFWLRHDGNGRVRRHPIGEGLSVLTAHDLNDPSSARIRRYRPLFLASAPPDPAAGDWSSWQLLLGSQASETGEPRDAMCIVTGGDYGTLSSSLIALPAEPGARPAWLFADGRPGEAAWEPVAL